MHDAIADRIVAYDQEILRQLREMARPDRRDADPPTPRKPAKACSFRRGESPLRQALHRLSGIDLTIAAVGVETVSLTVSDYWPDLPRLPDRRRQTSQEAAQAGQCQRCSARAAGGTSAAVAQPLDAYHRSLAQRSGVDVIVFATARKPAQWEYRLLRRGQPNLGR